MGIDLDAVEAKALRVVRAIENVSASDTYSEVELRAAIDVLRSATGARVVLDLVTQMRRREHELERLRRAMEKLNVVRSSIVHTHNATWANTVNPLIAILDEAGYEPMQPTPGQVAVHWHGYDGADVPVPGVAPA